MLFKYMKKEVYGKPLKHVNYNKILWRNGYDEVCVSRSFCIRE